MGKVLWALLLALSLGVVSAQESAGELPAPTLETLFAKRDLSVLEQLVSAAQKGSPDVVEAEHALALTAPDAELLGRLSRSLDIGVGANLAMDYYSQASPSYSISLSLDVVELLSGDDKKSVLAGRVVRARAQTRLAVVAAFTRYTVARNAAESAAQALETNEAQFRAVGSLLKVGEATLNDQLAARSAVSSAAVTLLSANAEVIVSLEALAGTVGMTAQAVAGVLTQKGTP